MNGLKTSTVAPVSSDQRGSIFEWKLPDHIQVTICVRKAGVQSGGHYHKGTDPSKNPERLFIAAGRVKLTCVDSEGRKEEKILGSGSRIIIYPDIKHYLEILEDAVILEYRITHFDKKNPDTFIVED